MLAVPLRRPLRPNLTFLAKLVGTNRYPLKRQTHRVFSILAKLAATLQVSQQSPCMTRRVEVQASNARPRPPEKVANPSLFAPTERPSRLISLGVLALPNLVLLVTRGGRSKLSLLWWNLLTRRHLRSSPEQVSAWQQVPRLIARPPSPGNLEKLLLPELYVE